MLLASILRSFKHRNFCLFFSGQFVSLLGTWMQSIAQSWLIYRLTGSAALLGVTVFMSQIPIFVLSPLAGVMADKLDRKRLLLLTQGCALVVALVLGLITLSGAIQVWHVLVLALFLGLATAFEAPARQAFFPELVEMQDLPNAIALNATMTTLARTLGPAVAGFVVAMIGEGWCFVGNAISYLGVIVGLCLIRVPDKRAGVVEFSSSRSVIKPILEGLHYIRGHRAIAALIMITAITSFTGIPFSTFVPIYAGEILKVGATGLGMLMGLAGAGALAGSISLTVNKNTDIMGRLITASCFLFSVALLIFAFSRSYYLSLVLVTLIGFLTVIQYACINTLLQVLTLGQYRGRVISIYYMMNVGSIPIGSIVEGYISKYLGVPLTIALGGLICLLAVVYLWRRLSEIRTTVRNVLP